MKQDVFTHANTQSMVWDLPLRLFHWLLLAAVAVAGITGFLLPATWLNIHLIAGTTLAVLLLFRLVWGFTGSSFSRFRSFAFSPRAIIAYARAQLRGTAEHFTGHNPLGAAMIFALLAVLAGLVATGLVVLGGAEKQGPLRALISFAVGNGVRELHEIAAYGLLGLIAAHVAGVIIEGRRTGENLPRAMITGRKSMAAHDRIQPPRHAAAIVAAAALAVGLGVPLLMLWRMPPAGVPAAALDPTYAKECGDCHNAFHPSLLTAATWTAVMATLDDHFGEDASLAGETATRLVSYLDANAADHWDTRAANVFRTMGVTDPLRITGTPYWTRRHGGIEEAVFKSARVASRSNCEACHGDARQGLFTPQAIKIPKE
ncbi:MAG: cytochrome b/b6 domain-containing protein [Alphaproteobacteria bacterium]|nr:cytochrome b/b6 domain-containing protein [Alphaproteobacteria bacterium]